jgi:hypothetical protein
LITFPANRLCLPTVKTTDPLVMFVCLTACITLIICWYTSLSFSPASSRKTMTTRSVYHCRQSSYIKLAC